jgi:hypothetical protein
MLDRLTIGRLYSNDDIFRSLNISNAGGIRVRVEADVVIRAAILTSTADFHVAGENPYHDRLEGEILTYTAAGKVGEQTLAGMNRRLIDQKEFHFPIHAFVQIASRRDKSIGPNAGSALACWNTCATTLIRNWTPPARFERSGCSNSGFIRISARSPLRWTGRCQVRF